MKVKKAVIPAAGIGSRMLPATKSIPKEMLPLVDKPVIQYIIEEAVASGIEDILIITNRGKGPIEDYFDCCPELEVRLEADKKYSFLEAVKTPANLANIFFLRQKETKGLGHAVGRARAFVGNEPFAVLLGDDVMKSKVPVTKQLIDAAEKYGAAAVGTQPVSDEAIVKYSSLKLEEYEKNIFRVTDMVEKPKFEDRFSNYPILGRYVLTPDIFDILDNTAPGVGGEIQLTDALKVLCKQSPMVAVEFEGVRYDTGNMRGFLEATIDYALDAPETGEWLKEFIKLKATKL